MNPPIITAIPPTPTPVPSSTRPSSEPRPGATIDEPALRTWMKQRLTSYKLPESYEFMAALPRDQSGKIRRSQLARERETMKVA